jgi:hypothetical protein
LIHLPSLEDLFEIAATEDEELGDLARTVVEMCLPEIERLAREKFENLGFYLEDQEGDAGPVSVIEITGEDLHIVEIEGDKIHFIWEVSVEFSADVVYDDMNTAIYDSEDKIAYAWQEIETSIERSEDLSVEGDVRFNRWPPHNPKLEAVHLVTSPDIGITVEEWDNYK